jgi:serine/threonine protein kinase
MEVGEKVAERFHVEAFIGAGGMGAVYRAKDEHTGAVVAIKSLLHADGDNERFARESRLLAELHHPGIVPYVAHGVTVDGERWLAMQWLEGEDLAERLDRSGLDLADALEVIRGAADALAAAHARGVVHRDVKPSNLFLEGGDPSRVRLLDFGFARDAGIARATLTGAVLGTPGYMAPEQARGEVGVGPAADVFSLGCVAFECLTATRPFVADHALAVVLRIVLEDAPRPRDRRADIPDDLDALVFEMLSKRAADRPKDAAEVARRLADVGAMPPSIRSRTLHLGAQPSLTEGEERLVSLVVAATMRRAPGPEVETALETAATVVTDGHLQSTGGSDRPPPGVPGNVRVHDALAAWQRIAREHGAHTDVLADGLLVATLGGHGTAADQAARAARCALAFRAAVPHVPMVLTTGRRDVRTRAVVGVAIDRAVELLRIETARRDSDFIPRVAPAPVVTTVLLDDVSAALLDVRFEVGGEPKELRGERDRADEGRLLLGKKSPSVGRDRELAHLEALFDECSAEPKACAVVVTASPGVGKSRLRSEVLARIGGRARSIWIGEGDAMRSGAPYAMIAPAVRRAAGIVHGEPLATSRDKLTKRVAGIVPPADAARTACFLGELCGVPFPDETSVELRAARHDPLVMGDQTRRAWSVLLEAETRSGPLVIVLEDLHWGDLPSVKLCDEALRDLRQRPLFVLALARPEVDDLFPQLWAKRGAHRIALGPLGRAASERLVTEALGSSVSAELVQRIAVRAGGNAFYLEELIRTVARAGG